MNRHTTDDMMNIPAPSAPEIEEAVLGAMLSDESDAADAIAELCSDDFHSAQNRQIFEVMAAMHKNGCSIDLLTVNERLKSLGLSEKVGGPAKLAEILSKNGVCAHTQYHRCLLKEKNIQRQIISACLKTLQEANAGSVNVGELIERAMSRMESACAVAETKKIKHISEIVDDTLQEIREIQAGGKISGVVTGYCQLDSILGPLKPGTLFILAGRTSHGKTQLATNIANMVASNGIPVGIFSLEMSDKSIARRFLTLTSGISGNQMDTPGLSNYEMDYLTTSARMVGRQPMYIDETAAISVAQFRNKAKRMVRVHNVALIIVDYLQLMTADNGNVATREQEVAYISRSLKATAKELDIPIIALAQLSRQAVQNPSPSGEPKLSDLRESGSIEQDADIVMFIHRPDALRMEGSPSTEIIVAKNRNGKVGRVGMIFDSQSLTFCEKVDDLPPEYDTEEITLF